MRHEKKETLNGDISMSQQKEDTKKDTVKGRH